MFTNLEVFVFFLIMKLHKFCLHKWNLFSKCKDFHEFNYHQRAILQSELEMILAQYESLAFSPIKINNCYKMKYWTLTSFLLTRIYWLSYCNSVQSVFLFKIWIYKYVLFLMFPRFHAWQIFYLGKSNVRNDVVMSFNLLI